MLAAVAAALAFEAGFFGFAFLGAWIGGRSASGLAGCRSTKSNPNLGPFGIPASDMGVDGGRGGRICSGGTRGAGLNWLGVCAFSIAAIAGATSSVGACVDALDL